LLIIKISLGDVNEKDFLIDFLIDNA
jgi:hypothetical protein